MNIINWLRTPPATLLVLCSALLAQLPHAADVFRLIVMGDGFWPVAHSYTYAIALELAVLLFVVQRRNVESYLFAAVSILVNLSYYYLHGVQLFSVAALPAWLVSFALPAAIAQYSHLIAAATDAAATPAPVQNDARRLWRWQWRRKTDAPAPQADAHPAAPVQVDDAAQPDARTRALRLANEGYTASEIARMTDAKRTTVQSWLRRAKPQMNGAQP